MFFDHCRREPRDSPNSFSSAADYTRCSFERQLRYALPKNRARISAKRLSDLAIFPQVIYKGLACLVD